MDMTPIECRWIRTATVSGKCLTQELSRDAESESTHGGFLPEICITSDCAQEDDRLPREGREWPCPSNKLGLVRLGGNWTAGCSRRLNHGQRPWVPRFSPVEL